MDPVIPLSSPWFDSIQPQLYSSAKNFYGKPVIHTRLESGDVMYVPSENAISSYAIEDSLTVSRMFLSNTSMDSFFFLNDQEDYSSISDDDQFHEFFTKMGKDEEIVFQKAIKLKQSWKEEERTHMENFPFKFM